MKQAAKILLIALAALAYGKGLYETLLVLYYAITGQEVIAGFVLVLFDLCISIPGLTGAGIVYIKTRRASDRPLTALAWASMSALLAAALPLLYSSLTIPDEVPPLPSEMIFWAFVVTSVLIYIIAPILVLRIRRRFRDRRTQPIRTPTVLLILLCALQLAAAQSADARNLFRIEENGKQGFIDASGRVAITPRFDAVKDFHEGFAPALKGRKWGLIDTSGWWLAKPKFSDIPYGFSEGMAAVKIDGKWGYLGRNGAYAVKPRFNGARSFSEGLAAVAVGKKWGYIKKNGQFAIPPRFYYEIEEEEGPSEFKQGLAAVVRGGKWGYIDHKGSFAIEPKFAYASDFSEGLAAVCTYDPLAGLNFGYINKEGTLVISGKYEGIAPFSESLAYVHDKAGGFFIDRKGNAVLRPKVNEAYGFKNGLSAVLTGSEKTGYKWGYIDKAGRYVWTPRRVRPEAPGILADYPYE